MKYNVMVLYMKGWNQKPANGSEQNFNSEMFYDWSVSDDTHYYDITSMWNP